MILVVCFHVSEYSGVDPYSYIKFFRLFRMPLFFFISGFILYKKEQIWDIANSINFLSKKFLVQIIPTAVFLLLFLFVFPSIIDGSLCGYWFTVTLFEYFFVYTFCNLLIKNKVVNDILLIFCALVLCYRLWWECNCHRRIRQRTYRRRAKRQYNRLSVSSRKKRWGRS